MAKWKRNIDEPYKVKFVPGKMHEMEPDDRLTVAQDIANKAVIDFISNIHERVMMLNGSADDFAFSVAISLDRIITSSLALLAEFDALQENHVKAYQIMIEKLPIEMELLLKKLKVKEWKG